MRQRIRSHLWVSGLVVALGLALIDGDPAHATTFDLTHTDLNLPGLSILVQVTPETCLGNPCLAVQYVSSNLANTPAGIHEIFFNPARFQLGNPPLVVSSDPPAWLSSTLKCPLPGLCQAGGFGSFDIDFTALAAEAGDLAVTLTLAAAVSNFGPNDAPHQADFAVALDFSGPDCHFVVSDGVADPLSAANGCSLRAAAPTPAPGTLLLIGVSLGGVLGMRWLANKGLLPTSLARS